MYTLLNGLYKHTFSKDEYYVILLGMNNAGKTTFVERLKNSYVKNYRGFFPEKITPTVGLNVARIEVDGIKIIFWDLGGAKDLHSIWEKYYSETHAIVYMVDGTDADLLDTSRVAYNTMIQNEDLADIPLLVLVNKLDYPDPIPLVTIENNFFDASQLGDRPARLVPISALGGDNIRYGVRWLASCLKMNIRPPRNKD